MTLIFKGRIIGNNIRKDWRSAPAVGEEPPEYDTSTVEFKQFQEPFVGQLTSFEIKGRYEIGTTVNVEITVMGEQIK